MDAGTVIGGGGERGGERERKRTGKGSSAREGEEEKEDKGEDPALQKEERRPTYGAKKR